MPKVTYITHDGISYATNVEVGQSAMEGAVNHAVPGIDGDCGGNAACATCHVYVEPSWTDRIGAAASDNEAQMLSLTDAAAPNSRLACQIKITAALDGLVLHLPAAQH